MAKHCIGLDIGPNWIKAVQLTRENGRYRIQHSHNALTRRKSDNPLNILKDLTAVRGFDRRSPVIINLPPDALFQTELKTDETSHFERFSPLIADNAISEIHPNGENTSTKQLTVVRRKIYHYLLTMVRQSGLKCRSIIPTARAIHTVALVNHPELSDQRVTIFYEDTRHCYLIISDLGKLAGHRAFPARSSGDDSFDQAIVNELDQTWYSLFGQAMPKQTPVYIASHAGDRLDLINHLVSERQYRVVELDPFAQVDCEEEIRDDYTLCLSEGLALHYFNASRQDQDNLIRLAKPQPKDSSLSVRKQTFTALILAGISLVSWLCGTLLERYVLEQHYSDLKDQIRMTFTETVPDEVNIIDEQAQLSQRLNDLKSDAGMISPYLIPQTGFAVWNQLQENMPELTIREIILENNQFQITALAQNEETVSRWQKQLENQAVFSHVEIIPVNEAKSEEMFNFRMKIELHLPEEASDKEVL